MREKCRFWCALAAMSALSSAFAQSQGAVKETGAVTAAAINGDMLTEESCELLATKAGESPKMRAVPGMHVLNRTAADPLVVVSAEQVQINAVVCWRATARLAPNDYLIPHKTGFPLYIKTETGDDKAERTIILEEIKGYFRVRLLSGPAWSDSEGNEFRQLIELYAQRIVTDRI